jgi:hypothetical protein
MNEQELRAWSLAISAIIQQGKPADFTKLIESAAVISGYIKTGAIPPTPPSKPSLSNMEW